MGRKFVSALLALGLLTSAAACGSDDDSSSNGSDEPAAGSAPGVTDTEVHVSGFITASVYGEAEAGARARIARANAEGGVHGREIVLDELHDDAGDPNTSVQQAQDTVRAGDTFAAMPVMTASFNGFEAMTSAKVPFFGWAIPPGFCGPQSFSFTGANCADGTEATDQMANLADALPDKGKGLKVALIGQDDDSARRAMDNFSARWEELGAEVVYAENPVPAAPTVVSDFTPYATAIAGTDADLAILLLAVPNGIGIVQKLGQLGFDGDLATFTLYDPRLAPIAKDTLVVLQTASFEETESPGIQAAIEDFETHAPETPHSLPALGGWLAADEFIAMLEATGEDLTLESFEETAETFTYDFGGAAGPIDNPRTQREPTGCNSVVRGTGEGYEVVVPYTCKDLIPVD